MSADAAVKTNGLYGVSVKMPDGGGWKEEQNLPDLPNVEFLAFTKHELRQATFALCRVKNLAPSATLTDPPTLQTIDSMLKQFGYDFPGNSVVTVANRQWRQYPVTTKNGGQVISGLVRFTRANDQIFMLSFLRGGTGAAQDAELQEAAASVQFLAPVVATVTPETPGGTPAAPVLNPSAKPAERAPTSATPPEEKLIAVGPWNFTRAQVQKVSWGAGGLFVLILLLRIISGGSKKDDQQPKPPARRL